MKTKPTEDIANLLKARNTLLWIVTREERRVERAIIAAAEAASFGVRFWDCATGMTDAAGKELDSSMQNPSDALKYVNERKEKIVYVMRDLHKWMDPMILRGVRSVVRMLQDAPLNQARAVVVLTPSIEVPPELAGHATVIDYPLPDRAEMAAILDGIVSTLKLDVRDKAVLPGQRDAAIDAVVGLTAEEAASCYAKSLVAGKRIDPILVSSEKKRVIAREKVLTWYDPNPIGFDAIGGMDELKPWAMRRKLAFSENAKAYGLSPPRGVLVVGPPGTGKSEFAKTIASAWGQVLLRLDMGALKSKWVGESEANIRRALQLAETVAPSILWIDEIEKALAGAQGPQGDGGVATDALGAVLTWMQERTAPVFVVATANDVRSLPPELLRKGRFDDIFFIDLPTTSERKAVLRVALTKYKQDVNAIDIEAVARATPDFTGAELANLIPDAMFRAFAEDGRKITTQDLIEEATKVVPLAKSASGKIESLRAWAKEKGTRRASRPEAEGDGTKGGIDIG